MDQELSVLYFLLIFNFIGAVAFGIGLRGVVRRQWMLLPPFFLVWGAGFGGIPLLIGAATFLGEGLPQFFAIQLTVVVLTIIAFVIIAIGIALLGTGMLTALRQDA